MLFSQIGFDVALGLASVVSVAAKAISRYAMSDFRKLPPPVNPIGTGEARKAA